MLPKIDDTYFPAGLSLLGADSCVAVPAHLCALAYDDDGCEVSRAFVCLFVCSCKLLSDADRHYCNSLTPMVFQQVKF